MEDVLRFPALWFRKSEQKRGAPVGAPNVSRIRALLPVAQLHLVDPCTVVVLTVIAIHLVVDGHTLPTCCGRRVVPVEVMLSTVDGQGDVVQFVVPGALNLEHYVRPLISHEAGAADSGRDPTIVWVVPDVPSASRAVTALASKY